MCNILNMCTAMMGAICIDSCEYGCQSSCQKNCQSSCESNCQTSCQSSCQSSCETSCQTSCQNSCQSSCETSCQTSCQNSCQSSCETSCQTSCQNSCQSSCETNCQTSCQSSCQSSCQISCQNCEGACMTNLENGQTNVFSYLKASVTSQTSVIKEDGTQGYISVNDPIRVLEIKNNQAYVEYPIGGSYKNRIARARLSSNLLTVSSINLEKTKAYIRDGVLENINSVYLEYNSVYKNYDTFYGEDSYRYFHPNADSPVNHMNTIVNLGKTLFNNKSFKISSYFGEIYNPAKTWSTINPLQEGEFINTSDNAFRGVHEGTDLTAGRGTQFHSINSGIVLVKGGSSFKFISILDEAHKKLVIYQHASSISNQLTAIPVGGSIEKGTPIGFEGTSGMSNIGPHVHIGIISITDTQIDWIKNTLIPTYKNKSANEIYETMRKKQLGVKGCTGSNLENDNPYVYFNKVL